MRILWLPHHNWDFIRQGQREFRLAGLLGAGHEVQFVTWREVRSKPLSALASLRRRSWQADGFAIHQARRVPNVLGRRVHEASDRGLRINELLHARTVREIVRRERIDVVICGISHQSVGLPPDDLPVPLVFDYLDFKLERSPDLELEYLRRADAVMCTSRVLVDRVARLNVDGHYLPNGVDLDAAARADPERVRRRYGLNGQPVVSLIGVTASRQPFYVDAIAEVARDVPGLVFLLVGDGGELGESMLRRAREHGLRVIATGPVPPSEVAHFFAASDVGLYPGDQTPYFDAACPLKVLEYSAAGKPVVATDLEELRNWSFPNVRLAAPTASAFARELRQALERPHVTPDLAGFRWSTLGDRLQRLLEGVVARGKG